MRLVSGRMPRRAPVDRGVKRAKRAMDVGYVRWQGRICGVVLYLPWRAYYVATVPKETTR
jgi:hypothetical protein